MQISVQSIRKDSCQPFGDSVHVFGGYIQRIDRDVYKRQDLDCDLSSDWRYVDILLCTVGQDSPLAAGCE